MPQSFAARYIRRVDPITFTLLLGRLGRLTETLATEVCAAEDMTPAELRVLSVLVHRDGGVASPRDVAAFVVQTSGGLTATLNRLEQQGLVERRPDPSDGRGRLVALTEAGRAVHDRTLGRLASTTTGSFDAAELAAAEPHLRLIIDALEREVGLPSSNGFVAATPGVPT